MRIVVADEFERVGLVTAGDEREVRVGVERAPDVAHLAVDLRGERRLGEARTDIRRNLRRGSAARDFSGRAIGKGDADPPGARETGLSGSAPHLDFAVPAKLFYDRQSGE